jgi:small-conductance mechanosensitive channel
MIEFITKAISNQIIQKVFFLLVGMVVIIITSRAIKRIVKNRVKILEVRYRGKKMISITSYILIVLLISIVFSDQLGGLVVALGVAGAGIAFVLQEVIASIAGWFAISFAHFYKIGDRVQVGGIKGDVIDISVLRTTLMEIGDWIHADLYNGRVVRIANSFVFKEPVFNYSGDFPFFCLHYTGNFHYQQARRVGIAPLEEARRIHTHRAPSASSESTHGLGK